MAYDGSLIFDTKIDSKGFEKGINGIKSAASTSMKVVGGLLTAGAAAVTAIGVASIKAGSSFEAGMSEVAATMGITVEEIKKGDKSFQMLEKAALEMGKATQFSASDATVALNYLALAGYDAEKAVDTLPTVLNLAAAGGLELGHSAEIITNSMNALGLETSQAASFVDQMAVAAQKSGTNVAQLGEGMLTVGGTAKMMAGGTVELATQLGILADNGIKGAEGGTALRNVLLALSAPTKKQAEALKGLGVESYDANGNLRNTDDIFQDLNKELSTMTEKERTEVLSKLFNKVDLKAANALLANSGERFGELSNEIANSEGAAAAMAETLNDNLLGKIELLKSAMEYFGIQVYKSMNTPLKGVIETLTGYVDKISGVLTAHDDIKASAEELGMTAEDLGYDLTKIPNGFEGATAAIGDILADIIVKVTDFAPKLLDMAVKLIQNLIKGIRDNLPRISQSAVELATGFITSFLTVLPELIVLGVELVANLIQGIANALPGLLPVALSAINTVVDAFMINMPLIATAGMQIIMMLIEGITENIDKTVNVAMDIISKIADFLIKNLPIIIEAGVKLLVALINGISNNASKLITIAIDLVVMVADAIIKNLPSIIQAGLKLIVALVKGIMDNLPKLIKEVPRIINSFADTIYSNLPKILATGIKIIAELIKGLIQSIPTLVANIPQIIMAIVNVFTLYNWWNIGSNLISKIEAGIMDMGPKLVQIVKNIGNNVFETVRYILNGGGVKLVGKNLIIGLMEGIKGISSSIISLVKTIGTNVITTIKGIFTGNAGKIGGDLVRGLWNGIANVQGWVLSKIKGFGLSIVNGIKDIFKIKSPSQVMRDEVGIMLGKGLAVGIDKSKNDVDDSANKMAKSVLDIAKKMNRDNKVEVTKYNEEIKQLEKRAKEDIHSIETKASKNKRKLTQDEVTRIQRIKEDSIKKIKALEEKASTESIKLAQQNSKLLLSMSEEYIKEKQRKGEMSLKDEVHFWNQLSLIVNSKSEEYKVALENKQKAISQINAEVIKINEDYTKQMLDIDKKLVEETEKLNDQYAKAYESRVSDLVGVGGLFNEFVENDMIAGDKLISNLESQVVALGQYEGIIGILGERIGNADLVSELEQLGPKSIGELKSLASLTDEQLAEYVNLYEVKFKMAARQAEKELAPMKENTERQIEELNKASQEKLSILQVEWTKSIQNLVTGTEKELDTLNLVGVNAIKGLEDGMLSMEGSLMETAQRIARNIASTIKSALDIHSPSRLMRDQVGKNITRGIGVGLKDGMTDLERDVKIEMSRLTKQMKATVDIETKSSARVITGSSGYSRGNEVITNNNDNGVTQNVTIVNPQRTPSENARELKKVGRDLALGY